MLFYFWMQHWADSLYEGDKGWVNFMLLYVPTAIYAVLIGILNGIYRTVAKKLNDFGEWDGYLCWIGGLLEAIFMPTLVPAMQYKSQKLCYFQNLLCDSETGRNMITNNWIDVVYDWLLVTGF